MAYLPFGNALGLVWGFVILAALVIKIRMMLQAALLEAAVEAAAKGDGSDDKRSTFVETFCPECENMLLANASFCIVCGTSVRSSSRQARSAMGVSAVPVAVGAAPPRLRRRCHRPSRRHRRPTKARPAPPSRPEPPPARRCKSSEEYFNSSRLKVIGTDHRGHGRRRCARRHRRRRLRPRPGRPRTTSSSRAATAPAGAAVPGRPRQLRPASATARGPGSPRGSRARTRPRQPSSVGSVSPGSGGFTDAPSDGATGRADAHRRAAAPTTGTEGRGGVTIEATGVDIYVPAELERGLPGREPTSSRATATAASRSRSPTPTDPSTAAGDVITQNLENLLPPENYTQLQTSDVVPLDPFGSVVSLAGDRVRSALGRQPGRGDHPRPDLRGRPPGRHGARHPDRARARRGLRVGLPET